MDSTGRIRKDWRRRCSGVTLTEVVVASALLAMALVPLLKALTATHVMDRVIERKTWSLLLAQDQLERIRARSIYHYGESYATESGALGDGYLCTVADDAHPTLRTVKVSVGLDRDDSGVLSSDEIEVNLCTLVAKRWPGP
jgi:Tfp pilus assembly protein PilV